MGFGAAGVSEVTFCRQKTRETIHSVRPKAKLTLLVIALTTISVRADDGAASIAAGGIIVMKREPRIVMAKEVLQISTKKVVVDYDFRNDSDQDITTEVAFPVPDYQVDEMQHQLSQQGFDDFHLWIEGMPAAFQIQTRGALKDKDYTELLTSVHVDIATFGHMGGLDDYPDIHKLPAAQHNHLEELGLLYPKDDEPLWQVRKKYHWQQRFPAHKIVHIRHEYTPVLGSSNSVSYGLGSNPDPMMAKEMESFCLDTPLHDKLRLIANGRDRSADYAYVDFLTTANTWKTPIEDFTLIVERPHSKTNRGETKTSYVSFCWDGPVTKMDTDHFSAHTVNLVPSKELRIGFFFVQPRRF